MSSLMVGISGIRGIVGETLAPEVVVRYVSAFAGYCDRGPIVIGRDGRITGKLIADIASSTLLAMGCNVIDLGICPTPTVQLAVEKLQASGGIAVTASHNPIQWNGLKFLASTGLFLNGEENKIFWKLAEEEPKYVPWDKNGSYSAKDDFLDQHIQAVLSLPYIKPAIIAKRKFRVVLDCVNAAGGLVIPKLLESLGCEVIPLNCEVTGVFAHTPEPIPENLVMLANRVVTEKADLGIAVDPDVDRVVFIDEYGRPIGEEYTVSSAIRFTLSKEEQKGAKVVVNLSTTRAVDDIAKRYEATVVRTPVGEINVASKMKEIGALVGGEGSGGVILPRVHLGRDALVGIGLIIQELAEFNGSMSAFKTSLPQYSIVKHKINLGTMDPDSIIESMKRRYASEKINEDDGLKIDFADYWIHLRKSNTEPIIRIIAEARTLEKAKKVVDNFLKDIQTL
jgi:phosphomannomutase